MQVRIAAAKVVELEDVEGFVGSGIVVMKKRVIFVNLEAVEELFATVF